MTVFCRCEKIHVILFITIFKLSMFLFTGLSLKGGGRRFSPATMNVAPGLLSLENGIKMKPKETPGCFNYSLSAFCT